MDWPPLDNIYEEDKIWEEPEIQRPPLRFRVGQRVECRIGPNPVTGWASGKIIKLWYQEPSWPPDSWVPYKVLLDNGNFFCAWRRGSDNPSKVRLVWANKLVSWSIIGQLVNYWSVGQLLVSQLVGGIIIFLVFVFLKSFFLCKVLLACIL